MDTLKEYCEYFSQRKPRKEMVKNLAFYVGALAVISLQHEGKTLDDCNTEVQEFFKKITSTKGQ